MEFQARIIRHERITERGFYLEQEQLVQRETRSEPKIKSMAMTSRDTYSRNIIALPGRIPYDKTQYKLAFKNQIDTPSGYRSIQSQINVGPGNTVNPSKLQKYLTSSKGNFTLINYRDPRAIIAITPGIRIAYITRENMWRSGGFYISAQRGNQTSDENFHYTHFLYKGFNNAVFSVQFSDIHMLYVKFPIEKQIGLVVYKDPGDETDYPVYIKNKLGQDVILAYCKTSWFQKRMINTLKYKKALRSGWVFENGTQQPSLSQFRFTLGSDSDSGSSGDSNDSSDSSDSSDSDSSDSE